MAGYRVDPVLLQEAKAAVDQGLLHFRAGAADLEMKRILLRDENAFEGGYGMTGQFRDGLVRFGNAWMDMIELLIEDEENFALFLEGFSTRLDGTHKLYQELESRTAQTFVDIAESMDGDR